MRICFSYQVESSQSVEPLPLISGSHGLTAGPKERRQIIPWNKEILLAFLRFFLGTAAGIAHPSKCLLFTIVLLVQRQLRFMEGSSSPATLLWVSQNQFSHIDRISTKNYGELL